MVSLASDPRYCGLAKIDCESGIRVLDLIVELVKAKVGWQITHHALVDFRDLSVSCMSTVVVVVCDVRVSQLLYVASDQDLLSVVSHIYICPKGCLVVLHKLVAVPGVSLAEGHCVSGPPHEGPVVAASLNNLGSLSMLSLDKGFKP